MSNHLECPSASSPDSATVEVEGGSAMPLQAPAASCDGDATADLLAPPASSCSPSASARRCNCKNSRCLKLYCECFAAGSYCNALCKCKCCLNTKRHMSERQAAIKATLERNAFAFQPKISSAAASEKQLDDASRHLKGCNCKKSNCLKKYCECFQAGVVCSSSCKCVDCLNFDGEALVAAKCRVPDRDRSKPSPKPLKRKPAHASSSSKVMSWDSALRSARAAPSDVSLQLQSCLQRGGSFESKIFGDDFFEAIQHAPAVKDAFALGGVKGIEALLGYLNPLLEAVAERAMREAAAAGSSECDHAAGGKGDGGGRIKNEEDSEHVESELGEDADDDDHEEEEEDEEEEEEEEESADSDSDDRDNSNDGDIANDQQLQIDEASSRLEDTERSSAELQGEGFAAGAAAHASIDVRGGPCAAAAQDDGMCGL